MSVSPNAYTGTRFAPRSNASFTKPFLALTKMRCLPRSVNICSASPPGSTYRW